MSGRRGLVDDPLDELQPGTLVRITHKGEPARAVFRRWAENGQAVVGLQRTDDRTKYSDYGTRVPRKNIVGVIDAD